MSEMGGVESRPETTQSQSDAATATAPEAGESGPALASDSTASDSTASDNQLHGDANPQTGDDLSAGPPPEAGEGIPAGIEQAQQMGDSIAQIGADLRSAGVTGGESQALDDVSASLTPWSDSASQHSVDGQDLPPMGPR
jgi:hypothetical protein